MLFFINSQNENGPSPQVFTGPFVQMHPQKFNERTSNDLYLANESDNLCIWGRYLRWGDTNCLFDLVSGRQVVFQDIFTR